jgi:hypothetical protein
VADLKLVGAVAIKVRPDVKGFKKKTEADLKEELRGVNGEVPVEAKLDATEARADAKKLEKELSGKQVNWKVKLDHDSVREAQKKFDSMLEPTKTIKFKLGDEKSIKKAAEKLEKMAEKAEVKITYTEDEKGFQSVLDKIAQVRRQKLEKTIGIKTTDEELDKWEKKIKSQMAKVAGDGIEIKAQSTIKFEYDENRASLVETLATIDRELGKFKDQQVYVSANKEALLKARAAVKEAIDDLPVKFEYDANRAGIEKAIAEIDAELDKVRPKVAIEATLDQAALEAARAQLMAELNNIQKTIEITYNSNRASLEKAIAEIDAALDDIHAVQIEVGLNEFELAWLRADLEAALDKIPVTLRYDENVAGLEKAIADIDAKLAEINKAEIEVQLNNSSLIFARERLRAELENQTVSIEYDTNLASLMAAKAKIEALLHIEKLNIKTKLDETSLLEALAKVNVMIKAAEADKLKIKPEVQVANMLKVFGALKLLTKSQTVDIFVKLNDSSVLLAAAKLTGLRAASRWTEEFARSIGTLDRNLPIVAAATLALSALSAGTVTLVGDMFSLGNGLGEVVRMGALLAPTLLTGLAAVMAVFTGVFKDFGAAVNGDTKAIDKLSESGKKAAAEIRVQFQKIRETVSANFWDKASESMLKFTQTALPSVGAGLGKLAGSMGKAFGGVLDSFTRLAENDGVTVFFANLSRGFDVAGPGIANFFDAFNKMAVLGSTMFPRLGNAFNDMSAKFASWVNRVSSDGTMARWIDKGIEGMKQLWSAGVSIVKVWGNIGQAAQAAGSLTLGSFAAMLDRLDKATAGARFQQNMKTIFAGAREASDAFHQSLGNLGPAMDRFSATIAATLVGSAKAFGAFLADVGDIMSSPRLTQGITAFTNGITAMFVSLRPSAGAVADILGTLGSILGKVATDSGPLFRDLFINLASVLDTAWAALEPFMPGLIEIGRTVIDVLGPAFSSLAREVIPAFARGVTDIGDGLKPVLGLLANLSVLAVKFVASMPIADIVGITTAVLALGGAMKFASVVVPIAVAALNTFRTTAAITATTTSLLVPGIGLLLAALTGFTAFAITNMATSMSNAAPDAAEYAAALEEDAKAAENLGNAIGDATTKVALHKLVTSGAYDEAEKFGIAASRVTDAVLDGGKALDDLKSQLKGIISEYDNAKDGAIAYSMSGQELSDSEKKNIEVQSARAEGAKKLLGILDQQAGSVRQAVKEHDRYNEVAKRAGVLTEEEAKAQEKLGVALQKTSSQIGAAASAGATLNDSFAGSAAKVDAMRKSIEIVLGPNAKQNIADSAGAYVKGFRDITESVKAVAPEIQALGDKIYGENGFLNTASGNSAVMQLNQALIDQVNNTWAAAKVVYDNTLRETGSAKEAFQKAKEFIDQHHGDFNKLAEESGISAERVQGQWEAVFGKEWVMKVTLGGFTEVTARAQEMITALHGQFDGEEFLAYLNANPDQALLAIKDANAAATNWVNQKWAAKLTALPDEAEATLQTLLNTTGEKWVRGDFQSTLTVANKIPGLSEALLQIFNGVKTPFTATIIAALNSGSLMQVEAQLQWWAQQPRFIHFGVTVDDLQRDLAMQGRGGRNGGILDGFGRGRSGFNLERALIGLAGGVKFFANGGIEQHVAQIARPGAMPRVWLERETQGEAYIPYALSKRPRSVSILKQVAQDFGYTLNKATQEFANGGISTTTGPTSHTSADVHIGSLVTVDMNEAVHKLRQSQRDALAVAGISSYGG